MKQITASHTSSLRCSRAQSASEKHSTDARKSRSAEECKTASIEEEDDAGDVDCNPSEGRVAVEVEGEFARAVDTKRDKDSEESGPADDCRVGATEVAGCV